MRHWNLALGITLAFSIVVVHVNTTRAESAPELHVSQAAAHDVSPPLRDLMTILSEVEGKATGSIAPLYRFPLVNQEAAQDPVVQQNAGVAFGAIMGLNFNGIGVGLGNFQPDQGVYPPDTSGAAGATQYVQWVNTSFAVFNKTNGNLLRGPSPGNTLWRGFGGDCESQNDGDPVVEYDKQAGRWVLSQFTAESPPYFECVAVSQTSDATGPYYRYAFKMGTALADYPRVGVWPDAYYFTFNRFRSTFGGAQLLGGRACAFDRVAMLNGEGAEAVCFDSPDTFGMVPSDWDGATAPPAGSPNYLVRMPTRQENQLQVFSFHTDFADPENAKFIGPAVIDVAAFTPACGVSSPVEQGGDTAAAAQQLPGCVPQKGTKVNLDELADRLMYRAAYRNFGDHEALVVTHTVARTTSGKKPEGAAIRWYELRGLSTTPTVFQQGTYAPDKQWRWMSSAGMDAVGDLAIGYSASGPMRFPAIRVSGRTPSDTPGMLQAESVIINGEAPQVAGGPAANNAWRWGDYSAMSIDPTDDCTFWYTNEYVTKKQQGPFWSTRIASFKFPGCSAH